MNESVLHLRQYPEKEEIAYPKPGTPNPKVRLICYWGSDTVLYVFEETY